MLTTLESAVSKVELGVGIYVDDYLGVYSTKTPPFPPPLTKPLAGAPI